MLKIGKLVLAHEQEVFSIVDKAIRREKGRLYQREYKGVSRNKKARRQYRTLL